MDASKLNEILKQHELWLDANEQGGERADLSYADLKGADLKGANLYRADLKGANLYCAYLRDADLWNANLRGANLEDANLRGANLEDADLTGANLEDADLTGANLEDADLTGAILPDISWIIPGYMAQLNEILYGFYLAKEEKYENFVQDSIGFIIQDNVEEKTFDILVGDRIIRGIPNWVKLSGMKQILS
jgi:Pentapeptide repeats (8 copies)